MIVPEESISLFTMGTLTGAAQDHEEEQAIELSIDQGRSTLKQADVGVVVSSNLLSPCTTSDIHVGQKPIHTIEV